MRLRCSIPLLALLSGLATAGAAVAAAADDAAFAQDILRAHNQVRCLHGVAPLAWHAGVAAYARHWVRQGGFDHSDSYNAPIGPLGENLYGSSEVPTGEIGRAHV